MRILRLSWVLGWSSAIVGWVLLASFITWHYLPPGIAGVVPGIVNVIVAALLAYFFGLRTYFKRREHELIQHRYVNEGVDRVRAHIQSMAKVIHENTAKATKMLTTLQRGQPPDADVIFEQVPPNFFVTVALYRLNMLLGDDIFGEWVARLDERCQGDWKGIRRKPQRRPGPIVGKHGPEASAPLIDKLQQFVGDYQGQPEKAVDVVAGLEFLASILDKDTSLNWSNLDTFKKRSDIKEVIASLRVRLHEYKKSHFVTAWEEETRVERDLGHLGYSPL